jgi:hypothetical protein
VPTGTYAAVLGGAIANGDVRWQKADYHKVKE